MIRLVALLASAFKVTEDSVYLSPAPIYHTAPLKWCASVQALGGTVVLMERFDAEEALAAIERFRVTVTQMVPTMFVRMLQLPEATRTAYDVSSLRMAVHAAAPCPPDVKDAMIAWWGPILAEYYGATEQHGTTVITTSEWQAKRGSVGKAAMGVLHICDDDGNELAAGEIDSIYFERDVAPFEYHNDPKKTAASRHPAHENWSTVGDVGYLDEDGYLFLTDRKGFMIISGGVNIYPQEVENALATAPEDLRRRGDRCAGLRDGRTRQGGRPIARRRRAFRRPGRRNHRLRARPDRALQGTEIGGFRHRTAKVGDRKAHETNPH